MDEPLQSQTPEERTVEFARLVHRNTTSNHLRNAAAAILADHGIEPVKHVVLPAEEQVAPVGHGETPVQHEESSEQQ